MTKVLAVTVVMALAATPGVAVAQAESLTLASELGSVLGAEAACGLKYNQEAIKAFIDAKVRADDMKFPSMLQSLSQGTAYRLKSMSESEKTAYCAQVTRVARTNKFIRD